MKRIVFGHADGECCVEWLTTFGLGSLRFKTDVIDCDVLYLCHLSGAVYNDRVLVLVEVARPIGAHGVLDHFSVSDAGSAWVRPGVTAFVVSP